MDALTAKIQSEIRKLGPITFARFMELALYCPVYGFYEKEGDNIGRGGDYYTSVSVGPLFGRMLAFQFAEWFDAEKMSRSGLPSYGARDPAGAHSPAPPTPPAQPDMPRSMPSTARQRFVGSESPGRSGVQPAVRLSPPLQLIEAGAHRGDLAHDILQWLRDQRPDLFQQVAYCIIEPSATRRCWQERTLAEFSGQVCWRHGFNDLLVGPAGSSSTPPFRIIFSNELLDALPVHRLGWDASQRAWFEWGVTVDGDGLTWIRLPPGPASEPVPEPGRISSSESRAAMRSLRRLVDSIQPTGPDAGSGLAATPVPRASMRRLPDFLPDGFTLEVSPTSEQWWRDAAGAVGQGKLLTIDYGRTLEEFLVPERTEGTLRAYRKHRARGDLLATPGQQDLTADVNFTALRNAGEASGLTTELFVSQEKFLTGIAAHIWNAQSVFGPWTRECTRQLQTLTHPEHLGRAFKALVQSRGAANRNEPAADEINQAGARDS